MAKPDSTHNTNPYQTYVGGQRRINADGLEVRDQAAKECTSAILRFFEKIKISETLFYNGTPCWEWIGCRQPNGYGQFKPDGRRGAKKSSPHRFAYEQFVAEIPEGYEVDHLCQVRYCANPVHLQAVTVQKNRKLRGSRQTHCKRGHEFTPENTMRNNNGNRKCRECQNQRVRDFYARNPGYNAAQCQKYQDKLKISDRDAP